MNIDLPSYLPSKGFVTGSDYRVSNLDSAVSGLTGLPGNVENITGEFGAQASIFIVSFEPALQVV